MTELQEKLLTLLKVNDELCRKYDIDYYLLGGSLIGALRHGGFIPWDDDADVIMTRDNWEKYYECTKGNLPEGYKISSQNEDVNVAMPINRLTETTTTGLFRYHLSAYETAGTQIDIFVMDPVPDTEEDKEIYRNAVAEYSELTALHVTYAFRFGKSTNFVKNWERSQIVGKRQVLEEIVAKAFHYSEEESQLYAQRFAGAPHFWPKEIFGKPQYVPFEDTMLPIPERPGDCLVVGYDDDWKYIPRSGSNLSTHEFAVRNYSIPSRVIWDDYLDHANNESLIERFIERKYEWENQFEERFRLECEIQQFAVEKVRCKYQKILESVDLEKLLEDKNYEKLDEIFKEYIDLQSNNRLIGSASLTGRIQYYRRNHPLLIDIGDEAVAAVIRTLLHYQRLGLAAKIMGARNVIERPLTEELESLNESIKRIRRIISTYGAGEKEECRRLTDEGLAIDSDNPFYIKHDIFLKVDASVDEDYIRDVVKKGIEVLSDESELIILLADSYYRSGMLKEALELYDYLIENSDNGLVLKRVSEMCKELYEKEDSDENLERWMRCRETCGEVLESSPFHMDEDSQDEHHVDDDDSTGNERDEDEEKGDGNDESEDSTSGMELDVKDEENSGVKKVRLELLKELDSICKENNLKYYLSGKALWQAELFGNYIGKMGAVAVIMTAEDAVRFQDIVNNSGMKDRAVESMLTNDDYFRIASMRYCNTSTLDMSVSTCGIIDNPGISIAIEIVRPKESNRITYMRHRLLEKGWEAKFQPEKNDKKTRISRAYVNMFCKKYGKNGTKHLFEELTKHSNNDDLLKQQECYLKNYRKKRKYLPSRLFAQTSNIDFGDNTFSTVKDYEDLLKAQIGDRWEKGAYNSDTINEFARIIDSDIPFADYVGFLQNEGVDSIGFYNRWMTSNWNYRKITAVTKLASRHWYILAASGERYRLHQQYKNSKDEIIKAYHESDVVKVGELMGDYYTIAQEYIKRRLIIYFDQDLFDVLLWYVKQVEPGEDGEKLAERLRHRQEEQEWSDLSRLEIENAEQTAEKV